MGAAHYSRWTLTPRWGEGRIAWTEVILLIGNVCRHGCVKAVWGDDLDYLSGK